MRNDEVLRQKGVGLDWETDTFAPDGHGMTDGDIVAYGKVVGELESLSREEVVTMRAGEATHRIIDKSLEDAGIVLHPDDPAWRQLEIAFIKAQRKDIQAIASRFRSLPHYQLRAYA